MRITPEWEPHKKLEAEAIAFLDSMGFASGSTTYHQVLDLEFQHLLQRNNDPTSLAVRTRADRIAVHKTIANLAFQYEIKTHTGKYDNMAVEAIQIAQHIMASRLGVRCLYIYCDRSGCDRGFWVDALPKIKEIHIPHGNEGISGFFYIAFPGVRIIHRDRTMGSGDPYCLIEKREVDGLRDWRHLIADWCLTAEDIALPSFIGNNSTEQSSLSLDW